MPFPVFWCILTVYKTPTFHICKTFDSKTSQLTHSKKVPGLKLGRGLNVWSWHVLSVLAWVSSGYSGFLPQSKDICVRLIGLPIFFFFFTIGWVCMVVCLHVALRWTGSLSEVYLYLSPEESWDRLQQIPVTLNWTKLVWIMDGCCVMFVCCHYCYRTTRWL